MHGWVGGFQTRGEESTRYSPPMILETKSLPQKYATICETSFHPPHLQNLVIFLVTVHFHEVQRPHEMLVLSPDYRLVGIQFPPDDATKIWRYPVKTHQPTPTYTIEWKREGSIRIIIHSVDEGLRSWIIPGRHCTIKSMEGGSGSGSRGGSAS